MVFCKCVIRLSTVTLFFVQDYSIVEYSHSEGPSLLVTGVGAVRVLGWEQVFSVW